MIFYDAFFIDCNSWSSRFRDVLQYLHRPSRQHRVPLEGIAFRRSVFLSSFLQNSWLTGKHYRSLQLNLSVMPPDFTAELEDCASTLSLERRTQRLSNPAQSTHLLVLPISKCEFCGIIFKSQTCGCNGDNLMDVLWAGERNLFSFGSISSTMPFF